MAAVDDVAHFIVAAVERVPLGAFLVSRRTGGKAQSHPRRIERATYRDIGMRFVAANLHPDHDTIAAFRRGNRTAIEAAFVHVLLLARETGLVRLGTVSIDGTKIDANASKYRSSTLTCSGTLVVWQQNRLGRSLPELVQIVAELE